VVARVTTSFFWLLVRRAARRLVDLYRGYLLLGYVPQHGAIIRDARSIRVGRNFRLSPGCKLLCQDPQAGSELVIGDNVALNFDVTLNADNGGQIIIGNDVLLGPGVYIRASNHRFISIDTPIRLQSHLPGKIIIDDGVWLGTNLVVLPNEHIGKGAVVGAGSVVTKDIPALTIAVGNPARAIKLRR
jgi:acetyltransferase-like isoleucine patch superfamily enzyme